MYSCGHLDESCEGTGVQPDLVVPICNLATWKAELEDHKFKATLDNIVRLGLQNKR